MVSEISSGFVDGLRRPWLGSDWHLDDVYIRGQGELRYLWHVVGQDGVVPDILVQSRRAGTAAKQCPWRPYKGMN